MRVRLRVGVDDKRANAALLPYDHLRFTWQAVAAAGLHVHHIAVRQVPYDDQTVVVRVGTITGGGVIHVDDCVAGQHRVAGKPEGECMNASRGNHVIVTGGARKVSFGVGCEGRIWDLRPDGMITLLRPCL